MKTPPKNPLVYLLRLVLATVLWSLAVHGAMAAGAPSFNSQGVSSITSTSAVMSVRLTANGADTTVYLELSDSGGPYNGIGCCILPGSVTDQPININLTGMKPGHAYSFRFVGTNSAGNAATGYQSFNTQAAAPTVTTLTATNIGTTSARFQAQITANGQFTSYFFQWGVSTNDIDQTNVVNPGFLGQLFDGVVTYDRFDLLPNQIYFYRAIAGNGVGTVYGNYVSFRTAGPPIVNTLAAGNVDVSTATLRATVDPNNLATQYYFEYGTSASYGAVVGQGSLAATAGQTVVTFNASGLARVQTYHYRIVASNALGRVFGPDRSFTTVSYAPTVTTLAPTSVTSNSATINGYVATSGEGASVWFEFGTSTSYGQRSGVQTLPASSSGNASASLINLTRGITVHYRFVGSNSFGIFYGQDVAFSIATQNDNCTNAYTIDSFSFTHVQSTADATSNGDAVPACGSGGAKGVWFRFTTPFSGLLHLDTLGSDFDTVVSVWSGPCGALTAIACNDDVTNGIHWSSNQLTIAGGDYYILASGFNGATGSLTLHSTFEPFAAPTGTVDSVTYLAARNVTLNGNVDPGNLPTSMWFEYGTNVAYGTTTPVQFNATRDPADITGTIYNLLPDTTYHYRLVASNSFGVFHSTDQTFTTAPDTSLIDITVPNDVYVSTSDNSPPTQIGLFAFDNRAGAKYLNFDKFNTGLTIAPSGNRVVRAITLISGDDFPERDPSSFLLEGSLDGVNFTRIASNAVPPFPARKYVQSIGFPNGTRYNVYRLRFPTIVNPAAANSMQIGEIELLPYPEITSSNDVVSLTLPPGAADVRGVIRLWDRNLGDTNKFEIAPIPAGSNTIVNVTLAAGSKILKGFQLIGAGDDFTYPEREPSSVTVAGSIDGVNYTNIVTAVPLPFGVNLFMQEFPCLTNTASYPRYRITFGPPVGGDRIQIGELRLFGDGPPSVVDSVVTARTHAAQWQATLQDTTPNTLVWLQYGTNLSYGYASAVQSLSGFANTTVSALIYPLTEGTAYHGRVAVSNALGIAYGPDRAFTTLTDTTAVDETLPGDFIAGSSGNSPVNEMPPQAIDNTVASKYLNFDELNSGLTIFPSGARTVRTLTLISAEDAPERDPSSFVLEGTDDGVTYTRIASNAVPLFAARNAIQSFAVPATNDYTAYRLTFPTVVNPATANSMQIAEVELLPYAELTSSNDVVSLALPQGGVDFRGVARLFDRQVGATNKLEIQQLGGNAIVDVTLAGGASVLKSFQLIGAADDLTFPERRAQTVDVAGSNDGTNYTPLASIVPPVPTANLQIREYAVNNNAAFVHYRITFSRPEVGNLLQVGEMRLFGQVQTAAPALSVRAAGGNLLVSWPNLAGFNLETKTNLNQPGWTPVTNAPVLSNGVNTVTVPMSASTGFFQLRK